MKLYRVEDIASGAVRTLIFEDAEALTDVYGFEIVWAIEEYGVCETDTYSVTEYPAFFVTYTA